MGKTGRRGYTLGAFLNEKLIAVSTIGPITRAETAEKQGLIQSDMRELVRFCIHPDFHKQNFASWFLSKVIDRYKQENPDVKMLVSFADKTHGHFGTVYKAANWLFDGETKPSYHYIDQHNAIIHKKTIYDRAAKEEMSERDYATANNYMRVKEDAKLRFIKSLHC
jgi:GNAT superfamily N-acetyltransferase